MCFRQVELARTRKRGFRVRRHQDCRFCPKGKGKVSHCFRRKSDYSLYLLCVPGQPQGQLFDAQMKTEEGEIFWLSSEGLSRLRESAESVGVLQYELDCELIASRLRADREIVVRLIMHIINIHVQYGR